MPEKRSFPLNPPQLECAKHQSNQNLFGKRFIVTVNNRAVYWNYWYNKYWVLLHEHLGINALTDSRPEGVKRPRARSVNALIPIEAQ